MAASEETFSSRHLGPRSADIEHMLSTLGLSNLDALIEEALPSQIRTQGALALPPGKSEQATLELLHQMD